MSSPSRLLPERFLNWLGSRPTLVTPVPANVPSQWALYSGALGSLLILFGSIGVGWLADDSVFTRNLLFVSLRTETWGVTTAVITILIGVMLLTRSWLRLGQGLRPWGPGASGPVVLALLLWGIPLAFSVPIYSGAVYAYVGQGRAMQLGTDPSGASAQIPYGPYFLWLERWVVQLTGGEPDASVLLFRVLALTGVVLCAYFGYRLARLHGIDGARTVWLTAANPLSLIYCIAGAHNEALMIGLAVAGVYYAARGNWLGGIVLSTVAIGIMPITAVALPFIGLLWAGPGACRTWKFLCWAGAALISSALLAASSLVYGLGLGWAKAVEDPSRALTAHTISGFMSNILDTMLSTAGLDGGAIANEVPLILHWVGIGVAVLLVFWEDDRHVVRRLGLAVMAIVILGPLMELEPWCVLWFFPFIAVTGVQDNWQVKLWYLTVVFFAVFGAQDQFHVFRLSGLPLPVETIAGFEALAFVAYLVLIDPKTRRIVFEHPGRTGLNTA